jgi:hypothetical protein
MPQVRASEDRAFARLLLTFPRRGLLLSAAWLVCAGCEGAIGDEAPFAARSGAAAGASSPAGPAIGPTSAAAASAQAADTQMRAENPTLFETARVYFPGDAAVNPPERLFRLTRTQLDVTTQALLPAHYTSPASSVMPRDPLQTNYEYAANLSFNPANFTPYTQWVEQLATSVRAKPQTVIDCAASNNAPTCLDQQARTFVAKAFRNVAPDAVISRYASFFSSSVQTVGIADATADLVDLTLTSPQYVFRDEVLPGAAALAPAQQLQNISYALADAPPDAVGLSLADPAAQLNSADAVAQTIERVLATPAARDKLLRFFISWLEVKEADEFALAPDVYPEFTPEVAAAAVQEAKAFLNKQLAGAAPKLKDVTQSTQSFVSTALASIYGIQSKSANGLVDLDPTQRLGIFTLPAVIASHSGPTTTRLVKRGVFFTRKVMCLPLGLPPPGVNTTLPVIDDATERQRVETATSSARCQGCHAYINPFGFMQENYDATGRWRTTDNGLPIDATIHVEFLDEGVLDTRTPIDALRGLTGSLRFQQCFARQLFRFYLGRDEVAGDDPTLRQMFFGFANQGTQDIVGMLQTLARSATFSQRSEAP